MERHKDIGPCQLNCTNMPVNIITAARYINRSVPNEANYLGARAVVVIDK